MELTESIITERRGAALIVTLNVPADGNPLNEASMDGLDLALDQVCTDRSLRCLVLKGKDGVFCEGMDFAEAAGAEDTIDLRKRLTPLWNLMVRMGTTPKPVIAMIDGRVSAGGLGLVAAADLAIATPRSSFLISELLFGLIPASIAPVLARRIGWQATWRLTLTARRFNAEEAARLGLLDEVAEDADDALRRVLMRLDRMPPAALAEAKAYFQDLNPLTDGQRDLALSALENRLADPDVAMGIRRFMSGGGLPWQTP